MLLLFLLRRRNGLHPAKTKAEVKETLFSVVVAIAFKENSRKKKKRTKKKKKKKKISLSLFSSFTFTSSSSSSRAAKRFCASQNLSDAF